jgi:hypothetical protein
MISGVGRAQAPRPRVLHPHVERDDVIASLPGPALACSQQRLSHPSPLLLLRYRKRLDVRVPLPCKIVLAARREGEAGALRRMRGQQQLGDEEQIGGKGRVQVSQHDCVVGTVDVLRYAPLGNGKVAESIGGLQGGTLRRSQEREGVCGCSDCGSRRPPAE